ncbi:MAG: hypothetical protein JST30_16330 [Armatimonadetes bacterium]|nr:hypothetical protein [Armatimonadota bacterium]
MKPIALVAFASALGGVMAGFALRPTAAGATTLALFGEAPKSADGTVTMDFEFSDPRTGAVLASRRGEARFEKGRFFAEVPSLERAGLYALKATAAGSAPFVNYVELQAGSPGTQQTGHMNLSGYVLAGRVGLGASPTLARLQIDEPGSLQGVRSITQSGVAVYGQSKATSGLGAGGYFTSASPGGRAIVGENTSATGATVSALFYNSSHDGIAVWGRPTATNSGTSIGVFGETATWNGYGVKGVTNANSQQTYGGWFESTTGLASALRATATGANAIQARNTSSSSVISVSSTSTSGGRGINVSVDGNAGTAIAGYVGGSNTSFYYDGCAAPFKTIIAGKPCIYGNGTGAGGSGIRATTSFSTAYGVFAEHTGGGAKVALHAVGNTEATGTKSFIIDHPLDPSNSFLLHYSSEGPEPYLIYRGTVTLGSSGKAWVELPDYFASINRDATVHLTPIGSAFQPFVAVEVKGNRFQVGGAPNAKVSWMVTAVRNDLYVQKYGYKAERAKSAEERGRYLHPELYKKPQSMNLSPDEARIVGPGASQERDVPNATPHD